MDDGCDYTAPEADILAVDDNNSNLMIVKYFLKRPEITPDTCDNGLEAVNMCKKKKYDLILPDHMMPESFLEQTIRKYLPDNKIITK